MRSHQLPPLLFRTPHPVPAQLLSSSSPDTLAMSSAPLVANCLGTAQLMLPGSTQRVREAVDNRHISLHDAVTGRFDSVHLTSIPDGHHAEPRCTQQCAPMNPDCSRAVRDRAFRPSGKASLRFLADNKMLFGSSCRSKDFYPLRQN